MKDYIRKKPIAPSDAGEPVVLTEYEYNAEWDEFEPIWREYECELAAVLIRGARQGGATLTAADCQILAEKLKGRWAPKQCGRPGVDATMIGLYCLICERRGKPIKAAVAEVAEVFKVSRSTAHAARHKFLSEQSQFLSE